ncbi:phosphoenolpyruvate carboxykinase (GTP) [Tessaracoccus sp. OH4464_COT-324]|uniref:phosphoenolpyruvate carboxykinase (GTP) n=1 Tax=Tessaracoccus sp. OH4464_COT-324 TaxID=2491059 RepID=UPI000F6436BC|nr:phosphoenolpyruvate carboxykinase (GTP) [Tessaracoccus sp. OH4464_COT-324]RRD47322.1 phosphoenolpyruvate carboxykinase (GTP) [Tessaracoccus sp. OH4464_COT-324]
MNAQLSPELELPDVPTTGRVPNHPRVLAWVKEVATLTKPKAIHFCDGSDEEYQRLVDLLVESGTVVRLNEEKKPNSIYTRTDPDDVARVEDQTFICSLDENDAGPTNNWMDPKQMKQIMTKLYDGCMVGRTMYVIPFCMGHVEAADPKFGIEITDSAYVVLSMKIMTRMGEEPMKAMEAKGADFVPALHSVGMPLPDGVQDVPWPCSDVKYIVHFPEERTIWSYGSGYGGNSLLGKKCYALRIASAMGRQEGWMAEHMLLLKLTSPEGKAYHIAAAFPSACGKTNLAMINPTIPGWKAETIGDDIVWIRVGEDGRLWAINPEDGMFGVAPGTGVGTNPNAMAAVEGGNSIFTNVALTDDGDVWWEGMTKEAPAHLTDWKGRSWTPEGGPVGGRVGEKAAHPNSRFCTPIRQIPTIAPEYDDPRGVPLDAIVFGGRRENTIPLVSQARSWQHGVFMGATCSSETTAAAKGAVGVLRRDPMAMLPFIGYHVGDYFRHWLDMGEKTTPDKLPQIFYVNWFLRDAEGNFLWPGFGENSRVLKWMVDRIEGRVDAVDTPAGLLPKDGDLDTEGLDIDPQVLHNVISYHEQEWKDELPRMRRWLRSLGLKVPQEINDELWHVAMKLIDPR